MAEISSGAGRGEEGGKGEVTGQCTQQTEQGCGFWNVDNRKWFDS
jgi:hypothetical protein